MHHRQIPAVEGGRAVQGSVALLRRGFATSPWLHALKLSSCRESIFPQKDYKIQAFHRFKQPWCFQLPGFVTSMFGKWWFPQSASWKHWELFFNHPLAGTTSRFSVAPGGPPCWSRSYQLQLLASNAQPARGPGTQLRTRRNSVSPRPNGAKRPRQKC